MSASDEIRFLNPPTMAQPSGYTHVVTVTNARMIYLSGQVALDAAGALVGEGDFGAQARQVFANIQAALEAVGASFADVIKLNLYLVNMAHLPLLREVRDRSIDTRKPPASTAVQVAGLARPEFLLEVEAIAAIGV